MAKMIFIFLFVASLFEILTATNICTWGFYMCARSNSQCISSGKRCNGLSQCNNGEDEENCPTRCSSYYYGYFRCSNNVCTSRNNVCNGINNCGDGSDESTALCGGTVFSLRLVGGRSSSEGRVEVYYSPTRTWGTICDDGWDINDANVVCRQLGLPRATQAVTLARFGQGTGPILLDDVGCTGTELTLSKCSSRGWKNHNCGHSEDVGVVCGGSPLPSPTGRPLPTVQPLTCYLCASPGHCRYPMTRVCPHGIRKCVKAKATIITGGQETEREWAVCDREYNSLCSSSLQEFCRGKRNCRRQCCSTNYCNDPRDGYGSEGNGGSNSKESKCYTCTSSSSYKDCEARSVLRTCNSGQSTCYKADYGIVSPTTAPYGQTSGTRRYSKGCVSSSQCTKYSLSFCRSNGAWNNDCNVYCCTGDGCNAGSSFGVGGVLLSACIIVLALLF